MNSDIVSIMAMFPAMQTLQSRSRQRLSRGAARLVASLSPSQIKAMVAIAVREKEGREAFILDELARVLCLGKSAASTLVTGLEKLGLAVRRQDAANRRQVRIVMAPAGERLALEVMAPSDRVIGDFLAKLPRKEARIFVKVAAAFADAVLEEGKL